jgi:hypothetical protein
MRMAPVPTESTTEYRQNRHWWWKTLRTLKDEWFPLDSKDFDTWVKDTHGVRIVYTNGLIAGHYEIADEMKHLVFILRYA